jgi:hypothetical protein
VQTSFSTPLSPVPAIGIQDFDSPWSSITTTHISEIAPYSTAAQFRHPELNTKALTICHRSFRMLLTSKSTEQLSYNSHYTLNSITTNSGTCFAAHVHQYESKISQLCSTLILLPCDTFSLSEWQSKAHVDNHDNH